MTTLIFVACIAYCLHVITRLFLEACGVKPAQRKPRGNVRIKGLALYLKHFNGKF